MKNSTTNRRVVSIAATFVIGLTAASASAVPVFEDDFESKSLSNWTGKSFGANDGRIVDDPYSHANHVLTFDTLEAGGEIFSAMFFEFAVSEVYEVSFDYLGKAKKGSVAGNLGGFVGYAQGTPGPHTWVYGTSAASGAVDALVDDGVWRTYTFEVDGATAFGGGADGFRLMFEDFSGSGGVAGDVFFDNISVSAVPSPGAGALAMLSFGMVSRRRKRVG